MRHLVFIIAYIYFLFIDIRKKEIDIRALFLYAVASIATLYFTKGDLSIDRMVDIAFSIAFGLVIYMFSYFSKEGIGMADGLYFVINGFLLTLKENLILFLTGLLVAFILGIFLYYFGNSKSRIDTRMPFMPCFLPAIIGYIICIV